MLVVSFLTCLFFRAVILRSVWHRSALQDIWVSKLYLSSILFSILLNRWIFSKTEIVCSFNESCSSLPSWIGSNSRSAHCATQSWVQGPPMLVCKCTSRHIKKALLPCWPSVVQQVSLQRWIRGIHYMQATKYTSQESTLLLKPRAKVTRSQKTGVLLMFPPQIFF